MRTEGQPRIEIRTRVQGQAVLFHELPQVLRAEVFLLLPVSVREVEMVQAKLVGHDDTRSSGTRLAIQWCPPMVSSHQTSPASAKAMPLGS